MKKVVSFLVKPSLRRTLFFTVAAIALEAFKKWSDEKTKQRELLSKHGRPDQATHKERKFAGKRDYVDESSWESFPASDASAKY